MTPKRRLVELFLTLPVRAQVEIGRRIHPVPGWTGGTATMAIIIAYAKQTGRLDELWDHVVRWHTRLGTELPEGHPEINPFRGEDNARNE